MGNASKWKESLVERTASRQNVNLMQLVYGKAEKTSTASVNSTVDEESDDEFFKPKGEGKKVCQLLILNFFYMASCPYYVGLWTSSIWNIGYKDVNSILGHANSFGCLLYVEITRRIRC